MLKFTGATLSFTDHPIGEKVLCTFTGDELRVEIGLRSFTVENKMRKYGARPYKPCMSHCVRVVERLKEKHKC